MLVNICLNTIIVCLTIFLLIVMSMFVAFVISIIKEYFEDKKEGR